MAPPGAAAPGERCAPLHEIRAEAEAAARAGRRIVLTDEGSGLSASAPMIGDRGVHSGWFARGCAPLSILVRSADAWTPLFRLLIGSAPRR